MICPVSQRREPWNQDEAAMQPVLPVALLLETGARFPFVLASILAAWYAPEAGPHSPCAPWSCLYTLALLPSAFSFPSWSQLVTPRSTIALAPSAFGNENGSSVP